MLPNMYEKQRGRYFNEQAHRQNGKMVYTCNIWSILICIVIEHRYFNEFSRKVIKYIHTIHIWFRDSLFNRCTC